MNYYIVIKVYRNAGLGGALDYGAGCDGAFDRAVEVRFGVR